jgi:hypothetical protein
MFLSHATITEIEKQEGGRFWLNAEITVPENVFAVELVLETFGSDAKSAPLSNLFAGIHNLTVEVSGPPPVGVGDTVPAKCFSEEEVKPL